ncbi:hypothetical protein QQ020_03570 [Fulvivirgaceae bacterium BMA12]|uniref:Uncharacterized protein n=1 Tax=Agaribacillus aureus TaxID=3051825 RepID=A0ABT8L041_9BACT|nr:hypothetical protein [Fulvivirgaceae bacterium BMA12]
MDDKKNRNSLKDYFQVGEVFSYFIRVFGKRDPGKPTSFNLRMMHGINKISIVVFLLAVFYLIIKRFI